MRRSAAVFLRVAAFACAIALAAPVARAEPVSSSDAQAIRGVIEAQLRAFAADDASAAFSYASAEIRTMFGTPEQFMAMVRTGYPVVYRPASVAFLLPLQVEGRFVQGVQMTDASGGVWLAVYRLERQADRSWRIAGCDVRPQAGRTT